MIKEFWNKFGGKWGDLQSAVNKKNPGQISEPVTLSAAVAAATPILIAAAALFKQLGLNTPAEDSEFNAAIEQGENDLLADPNIEKSFADVPEGTKVGTFKPRMRKATDDVPAPTKAPEPEPEGSKTNLLLPLGIAAAAVLLMKGK